jgi:hypothetical protein
MTGDELVGDSEGRDDVAAGASAGDEDAERRCTLVFEGRCISAHLLYGIARRRKWVVRQWA